MARITISKPYTMPKEDIRSAAQEFADTLERKHGMRAQWRGDSVRIKGRGIDGSLDFAGNTIDVSVKLGLLTSAFAPKLETQMKKFLDDHVS